MRGTDRTAGARRPKMAGPSARRKRRWKIERLFAWFHNYMAFLHVACAMILLRHL